MVMETVSEVLKRFNLSLDLPPEFLSIEVEGGYNRYEIEESDDEEDEDIREYIKYIFTSDYQRKKSYNGECYIEYIALLEITVSDENCSVGDCMQLAPGLPTRGCIYTKDSVIIT